MRFEPRARRDRTAAAALARTSDDEAEGLARFLRGMTIGALVGAAIAGSAIWQRTRGRTEQEVPLGDPPGVPAEDRDSH